MNVGARTGASAREAAAHGGAGAPVVAAWGGACYGPRRHQDIP